LFEELAVGKYIVMDKITDLMKACSLHDSMLLRDLLADPNIDVNERGPHGITALMVAAKFGFLFGAQELIRHGAYLDLQDDMGMTALMYAMQNNNLLMIKYLAPMDEVSWELTDKYGFKIIDPFLRQSKIILNELRDWLPSHVKKEVRI
jgi:ankyrin repeat protein